MDRLSLLVYNTSVLFKREAPTSIYKWWEQVTYDKKELCLFEQGINSYYNECLESAPYLSMFEVYLCKIILYLKTFVHELHHVFQRKLLFEDLQNENVETLIVKLHNSKEDDPFQGLSYRFLYDTVPIERIAELKASERVTKVL